MEKVISFTFCRRNLTFEIQPVIHHQLWYPEKVEIRIRINSKLLQSLKSCRLSHHSNPLEQQRVKCHLYLQYLQLMFQGLAILAQYTVGVFTVQYSAQELIYIILAMLNFNQRNWLVVETLLVSTSEGKQDVVCH